MYFPKISIVTPSFNQGKYIEQTILSIINQGYPNLEYIIIDGGSTDETIDIIKKYEAHITYWVSEPDKGQSDALNKGLAKCTGDIFNWINSDDYLEPDTISKIAALLDTKTDILCGYSRIFNDSDNVTIQYHRTELFKSTEQSFVEQKLNQQGMWYKLEIIKNLGGINTSLHYVMDLELFWRYLALYGQSRIKISEVRIAHFRIHSDSKTNSYEERFRNEERSILFYVLNKLKSEEDWLGYFKTDIQYSFKDWQMPALNPIKFKNEIAKKYLFQAFALKKIPFAKSAYLQLLRHKELEFNFNNFAVFVKLFIANLSFRKYIK